eukprot:gene17829-19612_t
MSSYYFGARKRNLSSDTTGSSDNEEEYAADNKHAVELQTASNFVKRTNYGNSSSRSRGGGPQVMERPAFKHARLDSESTDNETLYENEVDGNAKKHDLIQSGSDEDHPQAMSGDQSSGQYSNTAQKLMASMGYVEGKGLGKRQQGRVNIIEASKQRGRRGLGLTLTGLDPDEAAEWDPETDRTGEVPIPDWIPSCKYEPPKLHEIENWYSIGERKDVIDNETRFCDPEILKKMLNGKTIFDNLGSEEFLKARTRSNPYETIRGAIFQNRAAMKAAEIDASFDFLFTDPKDASGKSVTDFHNLLYFADICAGPGGFSEYVLWRKKWHSKADWANDFKINEFLAGSPETFEPYYGVGGCDGDGDIFREDNLIEFRRYVLENTDNKGVHFVMADGGFSVEGQENIQEILSKQLYICQFICAISILRTGGHFFCKLFDVFTPFSVGCLYLLYRAFEQVCIFKPVTSRPANSERYVVCKGKLPDAEAIHDYMFNINTKLNQLKGTQRDVNEVVPMQILTSDNDFFKYIYESNNLLGSRQIMSLLKLKTFVQNTLLNHPSQGKIRKDCLVRWNIPDDARAAPNRADPDERYYQLLKDTSIENSIQELNESSMKQVIGNILDYKFCVSGGSRIYLLSLGRFHVFQWEPSRLHGEPHWKKLEGSNLELPRDTLIEAELVAEYKGEGRGQRRMNAVHIIDAICLGGDFIADKSFSDRMRLIEVFTTALRKPSRSSMTILRPKQAHRLMDVYQVFSRMKNFQMKARGEIKSCLNIDEEKYFPPTGLHLFRCVKDPWSLHHSRSQGKLYFFNRKTGVSSFELPGVDSLATYEYCLKNRLYWSSDEQKSTFSRDILVDMVTYQLKKIGIT